MATGRQLVVSATYFLLEGTLGLSLLGEEENSELPCSLFVSLTRKMFLFFIALERSS